MATPGHIWISDKIIEIESQHDASLIGYGTPSYITVHNAGSAYDISDSFLLCGQRYLYFPPVYYNVYRSALVFDTSSLGVGFTVESAKLRLYCNYKNLNTDFDVVVVKGADIEDIPVKADYGDLLDETESRGSINSADVTVEQWAEIELNQYGRPEINVTGLTKFGLRSSKDIDIVAPTDVNVVRFSSYFGDYSAKLIINEEFKFRYIDADGIKRAVQSTKTGDIGNSGYLWVEGTYLHYIDANGDVWRFEGTLTGLTGKIPSQISINTKSGIDGTKLCYIDDTGAERCFEGTIG